MHNSYIFITGIYDLPHVFFKGKSSFDSLAYFELCITNERLKRVSHFIHTKPLMYEVV